MTDTQTHSHTVITRSDTSQQPYTSLPHHSRQSGRDRGFILIVKCQMSGDQMFGRGGAGQVHPRPGARAGEGREYDWLPDCRAGLGVPGSGPARPDLHSVARPYTSLALYMTHGDWKEGRNSTPAHTQHEMRVGSLYFHLSIVSLSCPLSS